jgi:predicted metal-dependent phosphoesterase TrpH
MQLKANFHLHSREDRYDVLTYSIYQAIDYAAELGYQLLAWTPHLQVLCTQAHIDYASARGILLFSGVETKIEGREVLLINCGAEVEKIKTFEQLRDYKKERGESLLIIAPHPFFPAKSVLSEKLLENIDLFDAIEKSWFYTKTVDFNLKAVKISQVTKKPLIATSDTHRLSCLKKSYSVINSEKDMASVFQAVREGNFENYSRPISLFYAIAFMLWLDYRPRAFWPRMKRKFKKILEK